MLNGKKRSEECLPLKMYTYYTNLNGKKDETEDVLIKKYKFSNNCLNSPHASTIKKTHRVVYVSVYTCNCKAKQFKNYRLLSTLYTKFII